MRLPAALQNSGIAWARISGFPLVVYAIGLLFLGASMAPIQASAQSQRQYTSVEMDSNIDGIETSAAEMLSQSVENASAGLSTVISVRLEQATLEEALEQISEKSGVSVVYGSDKVSVGKRIDLKVEGSTAREVFDHVLQDTGLQLRTFSEEQFVVIEEREASRKTNQFDSVTSAPVEGAPIEGVSGVQQPIGPRQPQTGTIAGTVTNAETGAPLPGVNVVLTGEQRGTSTNAEGEYTISDVEAGTYTLRASFIGFATERREGVEVVAGETTELNFALQEQSVQMEEVVAIGYGEQERRDLTGSVSSVDESEIEGAPFANIEQSLQGKMAGVNIVANSGEPGAGMDVQVRGVGTFGNTAPLYVVDGVPMQGQDMSTLDQSAIESVEVLKDASAAAIYGARASNGVVLITTKKGEAGELQVEYSGTAGVQSFTDYIPVLGSVEYAKLVNESTEAAGLPYEPAFHPADPQQNENLQHETDWQEEAFRTAPITKQNLRVSGGDENSSYMASGQYFNQQGVFVFNHYNRYSARVNTEFELFNDRVTVGENLSLSRTENFNGGRGNDLHFSYLLGASPTMRLYDSENEGGYGGPNAEETGVNNRANVIGRRDMRRTYDWNNRLLGNTFAEIDLIGNLEYRFNLGLNVNWGQYQRHHRTYDMDNRQQRRAYLNQSKSENYQTTIENTLRYEKSIYNDFDINLLGGYTRESSYYEFISGSVSEFASNDIRALSAGKGTPSLSGNREEWAIQSFVGRANVTIYDKYLLTGTIRRDGSSRFGEANRWGNFPSFALGWRISEESFFPQTEFLNQLKLRGSWGIIGNQEIGNYVNQTTMSTDIRYNFGNSMVTGASVTSLGNPNLKWEETKQLDLGIDTEWDVSSGRVDFHVDYFQKNTDGVLLRVPISVATGVDRNNGPFQNAASIENTGLEFELGWSQPIGDEGSYNISGNLSTINNEVTSLGGESRIINYVADVYPDYGGFVLTQEGLPMASFYGWVYDGIFQNQQEIDNHATQDGAHPGDVRFKDLNNDGVINDQDRTVIGNPWPDFTYGLSFNAEYKAFDVSLGIQGVQGRDLYPALRVFLESMNGEHGQMATTKNRWQPNDPSETMPRATRNDPNQNVRPSTRFVEDASYLRINNLEIGYSLPERWVGAVGIERSRVSIQGRNLLTITGYSLYNPDTRGGEGFRELSGNPLNMGVDAGAYPIPRVIQVGIDLTF